MDIYCEESVAIRGFPCSYKRFTAYVPRDVCGVDTTGIKADLVSEYIMIDIESRVYLSVSLPSCPNTGLVAFKGPPTGEPFTKLTFSSRYLAKVIQSEVSAGEHQ